MNNLTSQLNSQNTKRTTTCANWN